MLSAPDQINLVEGRNLPLSPSIFRDGTRLRTPWLRRGHYHGYVPGFSGHLIASYHGRISDCCWVVDGKRLHSPLRPGVISVVPESHDGHWDLPSPVDSAHVYLSNERLQMSAAPMTKGRRVELVPRVGFEDTIGATLLKLLFDERDLNDVSSTLFVEQALDLLCIQLVRCHSLIAPTSPPPVKGGLTRRQVDLVTSYMHEHMDEAISLDQLAALVQLSRYHFCRAFRHATGLAPHAWITAHRMRQARMLITTTSLPIYEIAMSVGYGTPSAFTATFRRTFGRVPLDFRR